MKEKYYFILLTLVLLTSCGSTTVKKIIDLPSLDKKAKVDVLMQAPTFGYEVVCKVTITRKGNYVSTNLSSYKSNIAKVARECGTNLALLSRLSGTSTTSYTVTNGNIGQSTGHNLAVIGYAIRKTTEDMKIKSKDIVKKISTAFQFGNTKALNILLKDVNKNREKRSPYDSELLETMLHKGSSLGKDCNIKGIDFLQNDYNVRLNKIERSIGKYRKLKPRDLIFCHDVLSENYKYLKNKISVARYIHQKAVTELNNYRGKRSDKKIMKIASIIPKIRSDIKIACDKDITSELCLYKSEYKKLRDLAVKIRKKNRKYFIIDKVIKELVI